MAYGDKTTCKACSKEIIQLGGGHRPRHYCNDACRQEAFRQRKEENHLQEVRQRWAGFTPETQVYLDWLMSHYSEELANRVAVVLAREIVDQGRTAGQQQIAALEQELAKDQRIASLTNHEKLQHDLLALGKALHYQRIINGRHYIAPGEEA